MKASLLLAVIAFSAIRVGSAAANVRQIEERLSPERLQAELGRPLGWNIRVYQSLLHP